MILTSYLRKRGHFFTFVQIIRDEEYQKSTELKQIIEAQLQAQTKDIDMLKRKTAFIARDERIEEVWKELIDQNITPYQFLNIVTEPEHRMCYSMAQ